VKDIPKLEKAGRMKKELVPILLVCLLMTSYIRIDFAVSAENGDSTATKYGVNYFSTHNHYEPYYLSDEELNRDFGLFRDQGLEYVTLCAIWKYLEPELGVYNEVAIDDLERVCEFASQYGLMVIINFYTMMKNNSWTMPEWLSPRKFEAVFLNETAREAWLGFLGHVAERLDGQDSIWSWHMMNEPWRREWACNVTIDEFLDLWGEMKDVFRAYSDRPVSVRFTVQAFEDPDHFNSDPRIYSLFDYLALNYYEIYCPGENLTRVVSEAQQNGCRVVISEFGSNATDDIDQANDYKRILGLFNSLGLVDRIAWMWRADYNSTNPDPPGVGYNLAKDVDGTPRKAFHILQPRHADVNHNGVVDVFDIYLVARAWGYELGEPGYNLDADLNDDGLINEHDLSMLNTQYGDQQTEPLCNRGACC